MRLTREELAREIGRVGGGDISAFVKVYNATSSKLYGIVVRILGRGELAEEVLQEVYLRIWQRAADYDAKKASPISWLAAIARNRALDDIRRKQLLSLDHRTELAEFASGEDILGQHLEDEEMRRLSHCLQLLGPQEREVLELVYFEGLSRDGVAALVGQSVATVRKWLRTSLAELKGCIEP